MIARRSYFGIGACCFFAIASGSLILMKLANWNATYKMAGFEGIIVLPFAIVVYVIGACLGAAGSQKAKENPFSMTGLALNVISVVAIAGLFVFAFAASMSRGF